MIVYNRQKSSCCCCCLSGIFNKKGEESIESQITCKQNSSGVRVSKVTKYLIDDEE